MEIGPIRDGEMVAHLEEGDEFYDHYREKWRYLRIALGGILCDNGYGEFKVFDFKDRVIPCMPSRRKIASSSESEGQVLGDSTGTKQQAV